MVHEPMKNYYLSTLAIFTMVALTGCDGKSTPTISGTVSFDGQPVNGYISFISVEGGGTPFSTEITDGRYETEKAYAGKRLVSINGIVGERTSIRVPNTREAAMKALQENKKEPEKDYLPENAVGNMQEIEVKAGKQVFDFELTSPAK